MKASQIMTKTVSSCLLEQKWQQLVTKSGYGNQSRRRKLYEVIVQTTGVHDQDYHRLRRNITTNTQRKQQPKQQPVTTKTKIIVHDVKKKHDKSWRKIKSWRNQPLIPNITIRTKKNAIVVDHDEDHNQARRKPQLATVSGTQPSVDSAYMYVRVHIYAVSPWQWKSNDNYLANLLNQ